MNDTDHSDYSELFEIQAQVTPVEVPTDLAESEDCTSDGC
jgi:hypothetical protein